MVTNMLDKEIIVTEQINIEDLLIKSIMSIINQRIRYFFVDFS